MEEEHLCSYCGRKAEFYFKSTGKWCCSKNVSLCPAIQEKKNKTCLEHYGVTNPSKLESVQETKRNNCISRYGVDNIMKLDSSKQKMKDSILSKYGVDNISKSQDFQNKKTETTRRNFGVDYWWQSEKGRQYLSEMSKENSESRNLKRIETCIQRYGVSHHMKTDYMRNLFHIKRCEEIYSKFLESDYVIPMFDLKYFIDHTHEELTWKCKKCGNIFNSEKMNVNWCMSDHFARCLKCYPIKSIQVSSYEYEIREYIKSIYNNDMLFNVKNIISPKELDIYLPDLNIAFEIDGLYWHSEIYKDKNYHLEKFNDCKRKNIHLINIFEDDWINKKDIVKSRILNILNKYDHKIYARKCMVKKIRYCECCDFLKNNHLQGEVTSSINYGLFYEGQLVSLMTFGKYRKCLGRNIINNEYELLRFCNKLGYHIPGSASKLLKHFIDDYNPTKIISYADKCWSIGNLYSKLGFSYVRDTTPNYFYLISTSKRSNRFNWRKSVLKNKLEIYDDKLTEHENMLNNKFYRIYDCGSILFEMNLKEK